MQKIIFTVYIKFIILNIAEQNEPYYQNQMPYYPDMDYSDYDESSECTCTCQNCEDLEPCCQNACNNCIQPPSIVFVPYPYPLIISTKEKETTTILTTQKTTRIPQGTTPGPPTTELAITEVLRNEGSINDIFAKEPNFNKNKFVFTNVRRTKPDWLSKYGIVPIPNNLAEKLMLQLRSMRVLHPKKETFKPSASLSSLEKII